MPGGEGSKEKITMKLLMDGNSTYGEESRLSYQSPGDRLSTSFIGKQKDVKRRSNPIKRFMGGPMGSTQNLGAYSTSFLGTMPNEKNRSYLLPS